MPLNGREEFEAKVEDVLNTSNGTFVIKAIIGSGQFGVVVKCLKNETGEDVAVKIVQKNLTQNETENQEITVLTSIGENVDKYNIVHFFESFTLFDKTFLVFEILEDNLFDFVHEHDDGPQPLLLKDLRPIAFQLLIALEKLKTLGIAHTDVKPDNIMFVNKVRLPNKVKLIDFGLAEHVSELGCLKRQPLEYRAPEVFLGRQATEAIDMWSLGCVLAELFLGFRAMHGASDYDVVRCIDSTLGPMPSGLLDSSPKAHRFFVEDLCETPAPVWRLKTRREMGIHSKRLKTRLRCLDDIVKARKFPVLKSFKDVMLENTDRLTFVSLIQDMLALEAQHRVTPSDALAHPFFTLEHLRGFTDCDGFLESVDVMRACEIEIEMTPFTQDTPTDDAVEYTIC